MRLALILTLFFLGSCSSMQTHDSVLRHVVVFRFKPEATAESVAAIERAFAALPESVLDDRGERVIVDFEWGTNNSPENLADGFTHCFLVSFASEDARQLYLDHPVHKEFVELLLPQLDKPFVVDYWAQP